MLHEVASRQFRNACRWHLTILNMYRTTVLRCVARAYRDTPATQVTNILFNVYWNCIIASLFLHCEDQ